MSAPSPRLQEKVRLWLRDVEKVGGKEYEELDAFRTGSGSTTKTTTPQSTSLDISRDSGFASQYGRKEEQTVPVKKLVHQPGIVLDVDILWVESYRKFWVRRTDGNFKR